MTWDKTAKALVFSSGRMVNGKEEDEVVDVICEAAGLDLTKTELEELEGFIQKIMSEWEASIKLFQIMLGGS